MLRSAPVIQRKTSRDPERPFEEDGNNPAPAPKKVLKEHTLRIHELCVCVHAAARGAGATHNIKGLNSLSEVVLPSIYEFSVSMVQMVQ